MNSHSMSFCYQWHVFICLKAVNCGKFLKVLVGLEYMTATNFFCLAHAFLNRALSSHLVSVGRNLTISQNFVEQKNLYHGKKVVCINY